MAEIVRQAVWSARMANSDATDKIHIRNLDVTVNAGVDVWGRQKKQRALVTVTLSLARPFDSAAEADALDKSTVHYGKLSKDIQSSVQSEASWMSTGALSELIRRQISHTADQTVLRSTEVDIFYPKSSMLGDGAGFSFSSFNTSVVSPVLYLQNVRIPCLIGVNSNERTAKQPVVVNLWIECLQQSRTDDYAKLESVVVNAISDSSFETLESLSTMVVRELRDKFFTGKDEKSYIRLRVEKPLAVPLADAPAIEILRPVKV